MNWKTTTSRLIFALLCSIERILVSTAVVVMITPNAILAQRPLPIDVVADEIGNRLGAECFSNPNASCDQCCLANCNRYFSSPYPFEICMLECTPFCNGWPRPVEPRGLPDVENGKFSVRELCRVVTSIADSFPDPASIRPGLVVTVLGVSIIVISVVAACGSGGALSPLAGGGIGIGAALIYLGHGNYLNSTTGVAYKAKNCQPAFCALVGDVY